MNFYDSERMTDLLKPHGYQLDDNEDDADLIVLNTCHIREKAVEKTYSESGRIRDKINTRKEKTGKSFEKSKRVVYLSCSSKKGD